MTRVTHRTRSESEHHVRGPGRKRPSPWTRNGTRITLGLGVWWGRTQGTPEARCRTQHSGDRPGAQRLRRVADPPNAKYLSVMGTAARSHPPAPLEGAGGRSRPVQPASRTPADPAGGPGVGRRGRASPKCTRSGQGGPQAPAGRDARHGCWDSLRPTPGCHSHPGPGKLRLAADQGPSLARLRARSQLPLKRTGVRRH